MAGRDLTLNIGANTKALNKALGKMRRDVRSATGNITQAMQNAGRQMTMAVTAPLAIMGAKSVQAFDVQAKAIAQVEAGLRSTGNAVGFTSKQLQQMASDLQAKTIFGDEEILKGATAQLLTFTNIAGKNFARTQAVALDLATRLDGDLKSASIQLGKALNDPVANLTALSRAGIQFSSDQKEVIKSLAETGQLAEAQTIILDELEKQYGGSAEAAAKAGTGPFKQLANTIGDVSEEFGKLIAEFLTPLVPKIQALAKGFSNLSDTQKKALLLVGTLAASAGPMLLFGAAAFKASLMLQGFKAQVMASRVAMLALNPMFPLVLASVAALGTAYLLLNARTIKATRLNDRLTKQLNKTRAAYKGLSSELKGKAATMSTENLQKRLAELDAQQKENNTTLKAASEGADIYARLNGENADSINMVRSEVARSTKATTEHKQAVAADVKIQQERAILLQELQDRLDAENDGTEDLTDNTIKLSAAKERLNAAMKVGEKLGLAPEDLNVGGLLSSLGKGAGDGTSNVFAAQFTLSDQQIADADASVTETLQNADDKLKSFQDSMLGFGQTIAGNIQNVFSQLAQGGQSFGQIMGDIIKQLLIKLVSMVAAFAILTAITGGGIGTLGSFLSSGFGIPGGLGPTPMAEGGIVSGPSHILAGEYAGAASNPEVIAPLSKLKGMIGGGNLSARVSGRDLLFTGNRDSRNARRQYTSTLISWEFDFTAR